MSFQYVKELRIDGIDRNADPIHSNMAKPVECPRVYRLTGNGNIDAYPRKNVRSDRYDVVDHIGVIHSLNTNPAYVPPFHRESTKNFL